MPKITKQAIRELGLTRDDLNAWYGRLEYTEDGEVSDVLMDAFIRVSKQKAILREASSISRWAIESGFASLPDQDGNKTPLVERIKK